MSSLSLTKEELLFMAKACEEAEKFKDMLLYAKQLALQAPDHGPTLEERNLISLAFRLNINEKRNSWRVAWCLEEKELTEGHPNAHLIVQLRKIIEEELKEMCNDCLSFVEENLLNSSHTAHSRVFFKKMIGDYYRYFVQCASENERAEVIEQCAAAYEQALEIAEAELEPIDPIRLGLVLNFTVFCYEIMNNQARSLEIARRAFDEALEKIEELDDNDYKNSTNIMQLLRDNIVLWTAGPEEEEKPEQAEQGN